MGLMIQSLGALPDDDRQYGRSFYIYLLDYGWGDNLSAEMYRFFPRMADAASSSDAVILRGTVGHHFADEVLAWHHVNGADAKDYLPGILVTTKHPKSFREHSWNSRQDPDRLLLVPLRGVCRSPRDVGPLIEHIFSDIREKRRLSEFGVSQRMVAGQNGAVLDALVLRPQDASSGVELGEIARFFDVRPAEKHMHPTHDTHTDVLLVTVTKIETMAVLQTFGFQHEPRNVLSIDGRIYFDLGTVNGARVRLTKSEMGSGGLGASQQAAQKGIDALSPSAVVMVGIAFGINEKKQNIGEVLITEQLRPYELQRVGTMESGEVCITLRDDKPHASPWLVNLLKSADLSWGGATLRFGTVLTGAKLVDNVDFRSQLLAFEPEAIGGEMEGAGIYVACQEKKIDWILVKAICDFADGHKGTEKEERQALAANNSAKFILHALQFATINWLARRSSVGQPQSNANLTQVEELRRLRAAVTDVVKLVREKSGTKSRPPMTVQLNGVASTPDGFVDIRTGAPLASPTPRRDSKDEAPNSIAKSPNDFAKITDGTRDPMACLNCRRLSRSLVAKLEGGATEYYKCALCGDSEEVHPYDAY